MRGPRLTYSNVVATLALFLALTGGIAWAAGNLGKNSVKSKNLAKGSVTSRAIKDRSVKLRDLSRQVTNGKDGIQGPAGKDGKDLSFDGKRMGKDLTAFDPIGNNVTGPANPVGTAPGVAVTFKCFLINGQTYTSASLKATQDGVLLIGGSGQPSILNDGDTSQIQGIIPLSAGVATPLGAFVRLGDGTAYDLRGLIYRQGANTPNALFGPVNKCATSTLGYEKVTE